MRRIPEISLDDNMVYFAEKDNPKELEILDDIDDIIVQDNPLLTGMLKKNNIKSCTAIAIYDHDANMVGILMLEYTETHNKEFLDDIEQKLIEKAPLLSPILEYSGIYNNNTTNN